MDVEHVASTVVHIASMPPDVAMLEVNIMYALLLSHFWCLVAEEKQGRRYAVCRQRINYNTFLTAMFCQRFLSRKGG